jgi:hypothetical protein
VQPPERGSSGARSITTLPDLFGPASCMRRQLICAFLAIWAQVLANVPCNAAPTLVVSDGVLTGARGVPVAGRLYDVEFHDGTCSDVDGACASFAFDYDGAVDAAWALLDLVLIDSPEPWMLDSRPNLVRGCVGTYDYCQIFTPARFETQGGTEFLVNAVAINQSSPSQYTDWVISGLLLPAHDTRPYQYQTWAVWTDVTPSSVALPSSASLTLLGMASLFAARRGRSKRVG